MTTIKQGPLHVSNKLSKGGESIVLISQDNQTIIDYLSFTEQTTDVSMGEIQTMLMNLCYMKILLLDYLIIKI